MALIRMAQITLKRIAAPTNYVGFITQLQSRDHSPIRFVSLFCRCVTILTPSSQVEQELYEESVAVREYLLRQLNAKVSLQANAAAARKIVPKEYPELPSVNADVALDEEIKALIRELSPTTPLQLLFAKQPCARIILHRWVCGYLHL